MNHRCGDARREGGLKMVRQLLRKEYRAVLTAGASEADVHEGKTTIEKVPHSSLNQVECVLPECSYLRRSLKIGAHIEVETGFTLKPLLATRIWERTAIEHESTAVAFPF